MTKPAINTSWAKSIVIYKAGGRGAKQGSKNLKAKGGEVISNSAKNISVPIDREAESLGSMIEAGGTMDSEVKYRMKQGTGSMMALGKWVFGRKPVRTKTKVTLLNAIPESRFLCSAESWLTLTKGMKKKLESWHWRPVRIANKAKYTERKATDALRRRSGIPTVLSVSSTRRIGLARRLNQTQPRFITAALQGQPVAVLHDEKCGPLLPSEWPDMVHDDMKKPQELTGQEKNKNNE